MTSCHKESVTLRHCPQCQSDKIHRSRGRNIWETWRKEITHKRLYRCHNCGWRGWGADLGPRFSEQERKTADQALVSDDRPRPAIRLEELDALDRMKPSRTATRSSIKEK